MKEHTILEDRAYKAMVTLTHGPSGAGKSLLSLLEGMAIASGKDLLFNGLQKVKKSKVLYVTSPDTLPDYVLNTRVDAICSVHRMRHPQNLDITDSWGIDPCGLVQDYSVIIIDDYRSCEGDLLKDFNIPALLPDHPALRVLEKGLLGALKMWVSDDTAIMINSTEFIPSTQIVFELKSATTEISEFYMRKNNFTFPWALPKQVHKVCVALRHREEGCLALFR